MPVLTFPVTLVESHMISPKVKHFVFNSTQTPAFNYLPGQFITIHFEHQGKSLKRSYSIANAPEQDNKIEFAAGYFENGPGTEFLFNLKPKEVIQISGPYGRLHLKEETPKRYIFVATSTGVTPYRAMLKELGQRLKQNPLLKIVILQGIQTRDEILYSEEFHFFAQQHPQVSFRAQLSRELEPLQINEHKGYVQHAFPELNLNPKEDVVYLCGNPGMIDESFNYLKDLGFDTQQIIREKYISGKI